MALEALWAVTFGTKEDFGSGVIVFETGRIFGGDTAFYYVGHFDYNRRDQRISGEVNVVRHRPGLPFVFPGHDGGKIQLSGPVSEPTMILSGHLVQDPQQAIAVVCRHLVDLP
jgi:glyoxylase-like metal-dependent hydrolase (beta-lactamase superfamily II)